MTTCDFCGEPIIPTDATPGYATHDGGKRACFKCCAWLDVIAMRAGRPIGLYAPASPHGPAGSFVKNWPGTLELAIVWRKDGRHNMAGRKTTYHFVGPDGSVWSGTEYHGPSSGSLLRGVRRINVKPSWMSR